MIFSAGRAKDKNVKRNSKVGKSEPKKADVNTSFFKIVSKLLSWFRS